MRSEPSEPVDEVYVSSYLTAFFKMSTCQQILSSVQIILDCTMYLSLAIAPSIRSTDADTSTVALYKVDKS
jgi:hypothetical protein